MHTPLAQVLEHMATTTPPGIHLGLERVEALLQRLGNPHRQLRFIHVAGTNGKGSTIAFLEAILLAQGIRVGTYTSPHLVRLNERIRIQGVELDDATLATAFVKILEASEAIPTTWFEKITVAAMCLFAEHGLTITSDTPSLVLLETGLGGRLDATNVVVPEVALVTALGLDHQEFLGSDIETIAWEKAGIFKNSVPARTSCTPGPALEVLIRHARRIGAPLQILGQDFFSIVAQADRSWIYTDAQGQLELPPPGLAGRHQYENAALAVAAIRALHPTWNVAPEAIARGITQVNWPGRLQRIATTTPPLLLDGAHNPLGIATLARALAEDPCPPAQRTVIFSALKDKDSPAMIKILVPLVDKVVVVAVGGLRGCPVETLTQQWQKVGKRVQVAPNLAAAWIRAREITPETGQIIITGSLYLVGEACSLLNSPSFL
ncbi:MAG: bifunctional folylpolyglutamate synthase/dihydrofolate synthase [Magnetococcales bacterium]|nr:bifunctional folylpolyglutamate synthase/dihydrofolate synthase [Magnetococcales bacterium]